MSNLFCHACEAPGVTPKSLGFFGDDGTMGTIAGFACRACGFIWQDADGVPVVTGRLDLHGLSALEWFVTGLNALGCNPRRRA